jgi:hypothetical protein
MLSRAIVAGVAFCLTGAAAQVSAIESYVGKYPWDKISGLSFLDHPIVRRAVSSAAPNSDVGATILEGGVAGPIDRQGSLIVSTMCEPHNCSDHQWAVVLLAPRGPAAICYHDAALMGEAGRWFVEGTTVVKSSGCWSGETIDIPNAVVARLVRGR